MTAHSEQERHEWATWEPECTGVGPAPVMTGFTDAWTRQHTDNPTISIVDIVLDGVL